MDICTIYTDGSATKNGQKDNIGGYAVIALDNNENIKYIYNTQEANTTNNRMEMKAIIYAFHKYGIKPKDEWDFASMSAIPTIYTDSMYSINTFTNWMFNWEKNGWLRSTNLPPENLDLVQEFYNYWMQGYRIHFKYVKGHSNNKWNELADKLATNSITKEEAIEKYGR